MRYLSVFSGCGWAYGFTLTQLPPQMLPQICESWLKSYLMQVCKPCHYTLVEGVEPFKLHPSSMWYIHKVFEHLLRSWIDIWLPTHTVTTKDASPDLGKLAEILPDASVQTMPLHFGWGFRTFQTASHAMPCMYEVFEHLLRLWMGIWLHILIITSTDTSPYLWELAESYLMKVCKSCLYMAAEPFKIHPISMSYIYEVFEHLLRLWMGIFTLTL